MTKRVPGKLSARDRDAAIERLYDVVIDPTRYEALLDQWESTMMPLRAGADFGAPHLLDDPLIEGHFQRASALLDRIEGKGDIIDFASILAPFERVAAFLLDKRLEVRAANDAAQNLLGVSPGASLADLLVQEDDIELIEDAVRSVFSDSREDTAILRVRARRKGRFMLLRLQLCQTADGQPLVLTASNELGWPEGYGDILQQTFGLTGAEADVLHGLVDCCSVIEIAERRDRSVDTIRAQIKSILAKTETHSQVELVRLALWMMDMASIAAKAAPGPRLINQDNTRLRERKFKTLITPDRRRLDYLVLGDPAGRPVLFLPWDQGLVRWPATAETAAEQQRMRIIVPVRAGYGGSDPVSETVDYDATLIADTLQVLDAEGAGPCPVITIARDFYYAVQIARRHPDRLTAIIACAGVPPMTRREQLERMGKWPRFIMSGAKYTPHLLPFMLKARFLLARKIGKRAFLRAVYDQSPADIATVEQPEVFEAIIAGSEVALSQTYSAQAAYARQLLGRQTQDWSEDLDLIRGRLPVFFINGTQDLQVPPATLEEFQQDQPWIEYTVHDDAGQLAFFRHWRDALKIVSGFLQ